MRFISGSEKNRPTLFGLGLFRSGGPPKSVAGKQDPSTVQRKPHYGLRAGLNFSLPHYYKNEDGLPKGGPLHFCSGGRTFRLRRMQPSGYEPDELLRLRRTPPRNILLKPFSSHSTLQPLLILHCFGASRELLGVHDPPICPFLGIMGRFEPVIQHPDIKILSVTGVVIPLFTLQTICVVRHEPPMKKKSPQRLSGGLFVAGARCTLYRRSSSSESHRLCNRHICQKSAQKHHLLRFHIFSSVRRQMYVPLGTSACHRTMKYPGPSDAVLAPMDF